MTTPRSQYVTYAYAMQSRVNTMNKSIELLDRFTTAHPEESMRQLSVNLGFNPTTLGTAKSRGALSPTVAGMVARAMGEDVMYWVAIAGLEAEKQNPARDKLLRQTSDWRKRSLTNRQKTTKLRKLRKIKGAARPLSFPTADE